MVSTGELVFLFFFRLFVIQTIYSAILPETDVSRKSGVPSSMLPKLFRSSPCCFLGLSAKDPSQTSPVPAVSCIVMADLTLPDSRPAFRTPALWFSSQCFVF